MFRKWILSGILCCMTAAFISGCTPKQPAETTAAETAETAAETVSYKSIGITVTMPEEFRNTTGAFYPHVVGEVKDGSGIRQMGFFYLALPKEEFDGIVETSRQRELTEDEVEHVRSTAGTLAMIFAVDGGRDFAAVRELFAESGTEFDEKYASEIGKAGDVTFYDYMEPNEDYTDGLEDKYAEEYLKLSGALDGALDKAEFSVPE